MSLYVLVCDTKFLQELSQARYSISSYFLSSKGIANVNVNCITVAEKLMPQFIMIYSEIHLSILLILVNKFKIL